MTIPSRPVKFTRIHAMRGQILAMMSLDELFSYCLDRLSLTTFDTSRLLRMRKMWKRTGKEFNVTAANGAKFVILEEVEILDAGSFDDPHASLEGLKRLRTRDGLHVNRRSDSEFEILNAGPMSEAVIASAI